MKGTDSAGRRYRALDPEAYHWVHATLVKGPVDAQSVFGKGMTEQEAEEYYREMRDVGRVWGLKYTDDLPPDWAAFTAYYDDMVDNRLEYNQSVRDVVDELIHPPAVPPAPGPALAAVRPDRRPLRAVGHRRYQLPPRLRDRLHLGWSRGSNAPCGASPAP